MPHAPFLDMADSTFTLDDLIRDPMFAARVGAEYRQMEKALSKRRAARVARVVHRRQQPRAETDLDRARRKVAALRSSSPVSDLQMAKRRLQQLGWKR